MRNNTTSTTEHESADQARLALKLDRAYEAMDPQGGACHGALMAKNIYKALVSDYIKVIYVDLSDGSYLEFTPDPETAELTESVSGDDFWTDVLVSAEHSLYHEDLARFEAAMRREHVLELMQDAPFIITYRLMVGDRPVWHTMKVLYSDNRTHALAAVRDIDIQKNREAEYEEKLHTMSLLVHRDAMTGVKNKNAFTQEEVKWDQLLADENDATGFAVVICDVNNLKNINDTYGHKDGDELIIDAARLVCDVFKHSPVFRIGGDEFAAVLSGRDYQNRSRLMGELEDRIRWGIGTHRLELACGMATFEPEGDASFADVFRRADARMYENKRSMKGA